MKKITLQDVFHNEKYKKYKLLFEMLYSKSKFVNTEIRKNKKIKTVKIISGAGRVELKHLRILLCKNPGLKIKKNDCVEDRKIINDEYKFPNAPRLSEALKKLIEFKLIERISDKKGKYYTVTSFGYREWEIDFNHMLINKCFPDDPDEILELSLKIMALFPENLLRKLND